MSISVVLYGFPVHLMITPIRHDADTSHCCNAPPTWSQKRNHKESTCVLPPGWIYSGFWLLASGFWLLASGFWLLASGFFLPASPQFPTDESFFIISKSTSQDCYKIPVFRQPDLLLTTYYLLLAPLFLHQKQSTSYIPNSPPSPIDICITHE
jgi:hypothetical protein